jgi:AGZA family xanthine/uracil permease-like MFS transporter
MPFAQACGMGLNAFFCTSFVANAHFAGVGVTEGYQAGLVIIFLSGVVFLILSVTGLRKYIATAMPDCLKKAIPAGIGLFIAFIGFQNVGFIQDNQYTLTQLFGFHKVLQEAPSLFEAWKLMSPVVLAFLA